MATDPPQAEDLRYWLRRFEELRQQERRRDERIMQLEGDQARLEAMMDPDLSGLMEERDG